MYCYFRVIACVKSYVISWEKSERLYSLKTQVTHILLPIFIVY
jgi:hypothetical protein